MTSLYDCVKAGKYVRDGVKMENNLRDCMIGHPPGGASYTEKMMNFLKKSEYGSVPFGGIGGGGSGRQGKGTVSF